MDDEAYRLRLLEILTNPEPTGIDPADPYGQADDGIDRHGGFGSEVRVESAEVVPGRHGPELRVGFVLELPPGWSDVPERGVASVPFEEEWRRLSGFDDPAAYAPDVARAVGWAAREHISRHRRTGEPQVVVLPDREEQARRLLDALAGLGTVRTLAPGRLEVDLPGDDDSDDPEDGPVTLTVVAAPEDWAEVLRRQGLDVGRYVEETLATVDPDERFPVCHEGELVRSTREALPPVRGRARERRWAALRAEGGDWGWYAYRPVDASPSAEGEEAGGSPGL